MALSLFLAKLFGIYMLVVALLWAIRSDAMSQVMEEFFANRAMIFMSGLLALVVGIAMAISHSVWECNWRGLLTLIGYLSIAKGVARVGFPDVPRKSAAYLLRDNRVWIWIGVSAVLGAYLTWAGFTQG